MVSQLRSLPPRTALRAIPITLVAALVIGIPADLIPTPLFGRPVPIRWFDYVVWAVTALLIGLILAIKVVVPAEEDEAQKMRAVWGGFASFLAVGCPVCNQMVVALIGVSGAASWWAGIQPFVGVAAVLLLLFALRKRLDTFQLTACPI